MNPAGATSKSAAAIDRAHAQGRAALIGYLPGGFPDLQQSIEAGIAMARNGADLIEIVVPYSDPVLDGPVIQNASSVPLQNGVVAGISSETDAAVLVMTYWNPVIRMGVRQFARRLAQAGGAGIVTPDLVPDEAADWLDVAEEYNLDRRSWGGHWREGSCGHCR